MIGFRFWVRRDRRLAILARCSIVLTGRAYQFAVVAVIAVVVVVVVVVAAAAAAIDVLSSRLSQADAGLAC